MLLPNELFSMQGDCGAVQCWCGWWNAMEVCSHTKRGSSFHYTHTYIHAHAHLCTFTHTSLYTKILAHLKNAHILRKLVVDFPYTSIFEISSIILYFWLKSEEASVFLLISSKYNLHRWLREFEKLFKPFWQWIKIFWGSHKRKYGLLVRDGRNLYTYINSVYVYVWTMFRVVSQQNWWALTDFCIRWCYDLEIGGLN